MGREHGTRPCSVRSDILILHHVDDQIVLVDGVWSGITGSCLKTR
jgi:hypothetical protein